MFWAVTLLVVSFWVGVAVGYIWGYQNANHDRNTEV